MNDNEQKLRQTRLENLQHLCQLHGTENSGKINVAKFARKVEKDPAQIRIYLNPKKKSGRWIGERLARDIEMALQLPSYWMDSKHSSVAEEKKQTYGNLQPSATKNINRPFAEWSSYCKDIDSINISKELRTMIVNSDIDVTEKSYGIEIDSDSFSDFPKGTQLLIEPEKKPRKGNIIVISFDEHGATLARYTPGLGELHIEPMERGMPATKSLESTTYTIHGVAIWQAQKGKKL